jgi:DNA-binding CsgD family transcriptional regulator
MACKFFNNAQRQFLQKGFGFTDRQMQIIDLICGGCNNTGLSNVLKITPQTAKTHVRNICRKTRDKGRANLILVLLHHSRHLCHYTD